MDEDECPDSTVMDDDDDDVEEQMISMTPIPRHRRSFDEPQSSRVSSSGAGASPYSQPSFSLHPQQLPPLPKLIFRPPTHAGNYPSVSFSSHPASSLTSRLSGAGSSASATSSASSASRLGGFPGSRSESFPGTRIGLNAQSLGNRAEQALPRLEPMSRSELTISRVSSTPGRNDGLPNLRISGISSTSRKNDFARVGGTGGVSISRISDGSVPFARAGASSSGQGNPPRIEIPQLQRIGSSIVQQADSSPSRKFGRRFLKSSTPTSSPKCAMQSAPPRLPMTIMRASSTDEYYTTGPPPAHLQPDDAIDSEAAMEFASTSSSAATRRAPHAASSTVTSSSRKTTLVATETLTSHQGSQGIKLHISKKPLEVIDMDDSSSERSNMSLTSSIQNNSDNNSNIGNSYDYSAPPSISVSANNSSSSLSAEEASVSVKPMKIKVPPTHRLKIPTTVVFPKAKVEEDEDDDDDDDEEVDKDVDEDTKDGIMVPVEDTDNNEASLQRKEPEFLKAIMMSQAKGALTEDPLRRTRRKRQAAATPGSESPPKMRRRRGAASASLGREETPTTTDPLIIASSEVASTPPTRGRGRGTGRGRGRPRGSTSKAKMERELLLKQQLQKEIDEENKEEKEEPDSEEKEGDSPVKGEVSDSEDGHKSKSASPITADTTSPEIGEGPSQPLPMEGDPEVNAELSANLTPGKRPRGGRGSRGGIVRTPRTPRGSRGARGQRTPRGERKSPEAKKLKLDKKEAIKAPPPVQVFEEETRMSADIKPPIPERITALTTTTVVVDEESRASNVSSTSTSTTAKAKRFTKDPIEERKPVTAETLFEYQWPLNDKNADFYFLQEQISEYLGVKSFKRKYPDIRRRVVDMEERDFLRDSKVVSETQCDLGLTAVHSCDVLDIMFSEYPDKYEEYRKVYQDRKEAEMSKLKCPQDGVETPAMRDRSAEFMRRILKSCAKWNMTNNRERMEERVCSFDLQTGTLHYPAVKAKVLPPASTKKGHYPVAVLPGQFTDHYKEYTPNELFYMPLNSVRFGPLSENWVVESDSSGESSDSDSDSDSDDSTGSSSDEAVSVADSEQNCITIADDAGNTLYRGRPGKTKVSGDATCKSCEGGISRNKDGNPEVLLHCSRCDVANHPTCLELTLDMLPFITKYHWECTDCKNCIECNDPADEDKMLFCDCCDRGYHIYCVGLRKVPTGRWHCSVCSLCYSCGATQPSPDDRMAEWHHEFRRGEKNSRFYLHSLCVACYKLHKKGHFCPSCHKVHVKFDRAELLECRKCEKWVHKGCVKRPLKSMFGFMCDPCDANFRSKSKLPSHVN